MTSPAAARVPASVWALLAAGLLSYGSSAILVRLAGDVPGGAIAVWRTLFVVALLAPATVLRARGELREMRPRERWVLAAAGVVFGLHFLAWIAAVQRTSVASASVLVSTSPLWIAAMALLGWGIRPDRRTVMALVAAVAGAAAIGFGGAGEGPTPPAPALGNALALAAAVLVAVYLVAGQGVRQRHSALAVFAPVNAAAAVTVLVVGLAAGVPLALPLPAVGLCAAMALGPGLLGHGSMAVAMRYLPATTLGLLGLAEPLLASMLAFGLFGELPAPLALGGMGVVLASIAAVIARGRARGSRGR